MGKAFACKVVGISTMEVQHHLHFQQCAACSLIFIKEPKSPWILIKMVSTTYQEEGSSFARLVDGYVRRKALQQSIQAR